jgi:hypothetical protein
MAEETAPRRDAVLRIRKNGEAMMKGSKPLNTFVRINRDGLPDPRRFINLK